VKFTEFRIGLHIPSGAYIGPSVIDGGERRSPTPRERDALWKALWGQAKKVALFKAAQQATDDVLGKGEYARRNRDNPGVPLKLRKGSKK